MASVSSESEKEYYNAVKDTITETNLRCSEVEKTKNQLMSVVSETIGKWGPYSFMCTDGECYMTINIKERCDMLLKFNKLWASKNNVPVEYVQVLDKKNNICQILEK